VETKKIVYYNEINNLLNDFAGCITTLLFILVKKNLTFIFRDSYFSSLNNWLSSTGRDSFLYVGRRVKKVGEENRKGGLSRNGARQGTKTMTKTRKILKKYFSTRNNPRK